MKICVLLLIKNDKPNKKYINLWKNIRKGYYLHFFAYFYVTATKYIIKLNYD